MFVILVESDVALYPVEEKLNKEYRRSSRLLLTRKNSSEIIAKISKPPLLNVGWLVYVQEMSKPVIKALSDTLESNLFIFKISSKQALAELTEQFENLKVPYKVINNLRISKAMMVKYIKENINISDKDAEYLVNVCNGYQRNILNAVRCLKSLSSSLPVQRPTTVPKMEMSGDFDADLKTLKRNMEESLAKGRNDALLHMMLSGSSKYRNDFESTVVITRKMIKKYVPRSSNIPIYELANFLVGEKTIYSKEDMIGLVGQYRYGFDTLLSTTKRLINDYLYVFKFVSSGELSLDNYLTMKQNMPPTIKVMSDYRLYRMIESYEHVSQDWLYFIYWNLESIETNNSGIYKIINLIKLCGGETYNV